MAELKDFIVRTRLGNTDENQNTGNSAFDTQDYVFFETYEEVKNINAEECYVYASDYAVMNGAFLGGQERGPKDRQSTWHWLRSADSEFYVNGVFNDGSLNSSLADIESAGLCPALHLNLASVISARSASRDFKIEPFKDKSGKILYHTIEFGSYPQDKAKNSSELERLFNAHKLTPTGKTYTGYMKEDGSFQQNQEFEYSGKKYVRVISKKYDNDSEYKDKTKAPENGTPMWAEVQPIKWKIKNWDELPRSINPNGKGTAKTIYVKSEEGIMSGIPFYPEYGETEHTMWQNSPLRAIFNGYDLHNELNNGNGNKRYKAGINYNFKGKGFLQEAFDSSFTRSSTITQEDEKELKEEKSNPYGFTFEELDNDKLLKLYVQSNAAIFLHGPSGVGKSGRVKQLDPTATRITLRPQMNPEEVDGTLDRETGKFIPPLWYTQLCEKCKAEPGRKHVLFIDELTNVKPTVQSLIYSIVLDRAGKDGLWPLPENAVIVAAGNENADNLAAYPLTNALFRRFSHIYYEVDKNSWLDWATGVSKVQKQEHVKEDKSDRARIHPAIVAYIMSRDEGVLNQDLDEENPHIVTDPRKWEIASNVLYTTKNPNALKPAIGEDLTADFVDFVKSIQLSVDDVLKGRYNARDYAEMDISKKLSTLVGLCMASEKDLPVIRGFISSTMGKEILATYDSLWIRNDPERAEIIAECGLNLVKEGKGNDLEF
jgi:hypothetical protein